MPCLWIQVQQLTRLQTAKDVATRTCARPGYAVQHRHVDSTPPTRPAVDRRDIRRRSTRPRLTHRRHRPPSTTQTAMYLGCYIKRKENNTQFRPYVHENFEKFKIISTPTGSWIRSRQRRDRIQLPVGVEIILNFSKLRVPIRRAGDNGTIGQKHQNYFKIFHSLCTTIEGGGLYWVYRYLVLWRPGLEREWSACECSTERSRGCAGRRWPKNERENWSIGTLGVESI